MFLPSQDYSPLGKFKVLTEICFTLKALVRKGRL